MATQTTTQRAEAGKKAAATRKRNSARRTATATRRSASRTGTRARQTGRAASGTRRQAQTTGRLGVHTLEQELDYAGTRLSAVALSAKRGVAIQVGAALEARDVIVRTAQSAVRAASRRRTLNRLERRGERALNWKRR